MIFQNVVDAVEEVLIEQGVPISVQEKILDDVFNRLSDNLEEDKEDEEDE